MAANDPTLRSVLSSRASATRISRLDAEGRRAMTAKARAARWTREIAQVRADAAERGEWLDDREAEQRAYELRCERLAAASRKGVEARLRYAADRAALLEAIRLAVAEGRLQLPLASPTEAGQ